MRFTRLLLLSLALTHCSAQTLIFANNQDSTVTLLKAADYSVLATLPTGAGEHGGGPHEIAISKDGNFAYVADAGNNNKKGTTITVVDIKKQAVVRQIDVFPHGPHDLAISRDGRKLWAACASTKSVLEIDPVTGHVARQWKMEAEGGWMLTVTPDEKKIYVANLEGGAVTAIHRASGKVVTVPLEKGEMGFDVAPKGHFLWTASVDKSVISIIDTSNDKPVATFPSGSEGPVRLKFTPDGKHVLVGHGPGKKLVIFDAQTHKIEREIELTSAPKILAISGDGQKAYLSNPVDDSLTVVDLQKYQVERTVKTGKQPDGVAWAR
jgi:YVTN family beta-propeller protein